MKCMLKDHFVSFMWLACIICKFCNGSRDFILFLTALCCHNHEMFSHVAVPNLIHSASSNLCSRWGKLSFLHYIYILPSSPLCSLHWQGDAEKQYCVWWGNYGLCCNVCAQGACSNTAHFLSSACNINRGGRKHKFSEEETLGCFYYL